MLILENVINDIKGHPAKQHGVTTAMLNESYIQFLESKETLQEAMLRNDLRIMLEGEGEKGFFAKIGDKIKEFWKKVKAFFAKIWNWIKEKFSKVTGWIKGIFQKTGAKPGDVDAFINKNQDKYKVTVLAEGAIKKLFELNMKLFNLIQKVDLSKYFKEVIELTETAKSKKEKDNADKKAQEKFKELLKDHKEDLSAIGKDILELMSKKETEEVVADSKALARYQSYHIQVQKLVDGMTKYFSGLAVDKLLETAMHKLDGNKEAESMLSALSGISSLVATEGMKSARTTNEISASFEKIAHRYGQAVTDSVKEKGHVKED